MIEHSDAPLLLVFIVLCTVVVFSLLTVVIVLSIKYARARKIHKMTPLIGVVLPRDK